MDHNSHHYARVVVQFKAPDNCRNKIVAVQDELRKIDPSQEYKEPDDLHISVTAFAFAKAQSDFSRYESLVARLGLVASEFSSFQVSITGLHFFPTAVYSRVQDHPAGNLQTIKQRVDAELKKEHFVEPIVVGTSYIPHVTLAMFKTDDVSTLHNTVESEPFRSCDFGTGTLEELEITERNVSDLPNRTRASIFGSLRKRFAKTDSVLQQEPANKTALTLRRKSV